MGTETEIFDLNYKGAKIKVQQHIVTNQVVYRVQFGDRRLPLIITRATNANAARWWTSVPEGRQKEAEEIGPLIAEYIKSKQ